MLRGTDFVADARVAEFLFGILGIHPEHVERHLAVNRNRLDAMNDRVRVPLSMASACRETPGVLQRHLSDIE